MVFLTAMDPMSRSSWLKPNTMLSRLYLAEIAASVTGGIQTTGRDGLVDTFINR
tara:strand:+ start:1145 stop:1306 length:162 start_codon:yes stop_codon:yes gene_type:complete